MLKVLTIALSIGLACALSGCHRSTAPESTEQTASASPRPSSPPLSDFERSLKFVRDGQFTYIYVISRKDGKPLDSQDSDFLRKNAPQVVDWVTTEDKTKVIGGTNFNLEEGNLSVIKKRLIVEDYTGR